MKASAVSRLGNSLVFGMAQPVMDLLSSMANHADSLGTWKAALYLRRTRETKEGA